MSTPSNPIVRAIAAVATGGLSEGPAQLKSAGTVATGLLSGQDPLEALKGGGKALRSGGTPKDLLTPKPVMSPSTSPVTSPATHTVVTPAASLRQRRDFSTLLTGSQGDTSAATVKKKTLLGGSSNTLGS